MLELLSTAGSFVIFQIFTHPKSKVRKKMPVLKIKRLEISPCLRLHLETKVIHIHHWVYYSVILIVSIPTHFKLLDAAAVQGFLLGSIIQGFLINSKSRKLIFSKPLEVSDDYR